MRLFVPLFFIFFWAPAFGQVKTTQKHFSVESATQRKWSPGVVQKNAKREGGMIYEVVVKVKKGGDYQFAYLIVEGQPLEIEVIADGQRNAKGPFSKRSKITLVSRTEAGKTITADAKWKESLPPTDSKQVWLAYQLGTKQYLLPIPAWREAGTPQNQ